MSELSGPTSPCCPGFVVKLDKTAQVQSLHPPCSRQSTFVLNVVTATPCDQYALSIILYSENKVVFYLFLLFVLLNSNSLQNVFLLLAEFALFI